MYFEGIHAILPEVVQWNPGQGVPLMPLKNNQILTFSTPADAEQIYNIARQVSSTCVLVGGTPEKLEYVAQPTGFLVPAQGMVEFFIGDGGNYVYNTTDGPRPYMLYDPAHNINQQVSWLVATYAAGKEGLAIVPTGSGASMFQWA